MNPTSPALELQTVADGFWNISPKTPVELDITGQVELFHGLDNLARVIRIHPGASVIYRSLTTESVTSKIRFEVLDSAKLVVRAGFFGNANAPIASVIEAVVMGSKVEADIEILGLAFERASLDIDGILTIEAGCKEVVGSIRETNVFIADTGMIRGVPTLKVRSDDVKASHSCTIERLSDEHRFYLEGRGLSEQDAKMTLLDGKISHLYAGLADESLEAIRSQFLT
ncbi:MAG: SufD family Fe-S cluster assembly protein [Patescibacteria group bacterium]